MNSLHIKIETLLFSLLILFLPTQFGKHFWPDFSIVQGIRIDYLSPTLYLTDLLTGLLFLFWIVRVIRNRTFIKSYALGFRIYSAVSLYLLLNVVSSTNVPGSAYSLVKFLECSFMAFYAASVIPSRFSFVRVTSLLAVGVIAESFFAIVQYLNQGSIGGLLYFLGERSFTAGTPGIANASINGELIMRAYGTFPHPNVLAGYLIVSMTLILFLLFPTPSKSAKYLAGTSILLGTAGLLLTLSRTAISLWLLLLLIIFVQQIINGIRQKTNQVFTLLIGIACLILVGSYIFWQTLTPRFLQSAFTEEAFVQRALLNEAALRMIGQHPLFGVGLGNFLPSLGPLQAPLSLGLYLQPVHNIFLLVAAETGILGLLFFLGLLAASYHRLFRRANKNSRRSLPLLLCLSIMLILGQFDHYWLTLQQGQLLISLVLGMTFHQASNSFQLGKPKITRKRDPF